MNKKEIISKAESFARGAGIVSFIGFCSAWVMLYSDDALISPLGIPVGLFCCSCFAASKALTKEIERARKNDDG